jgi:hypothetical protein
MWWKWFNKSQIRKHEWKRLKDLNKQVEAAFLLVTASLPILVTLMMVALSSSETSVLKRATRHNIPGDVILHACFRFVAAQITLDPVWDRKEFEHVKMNN